MNEVNANECQANADDGSHGLVVRNRTVMRGSFEVNVVQPGLCWPVPDLPWIILNHSIIILYHSIIILYYSIIILYHSILASIIRLPFSDHSNPPLNHSLSFAERSIWLSINR